MKKFKEYFVEKKLLVFDGAIGTYIYSKGVPKGHCYDELNISMPSIIEEIHKEYIEAGAEIITTNTFGANRFILEEYFALGDKVKEINYYGARIAKKVSKGRAFVAGSIGPISRPLDTEKELNDEEKKEIFKEQIEALLEGGADLLIFETYFSPKELLLGINTAREISKEVFIIAEMSFPNNGLTIKGCSPFDFAYSTKKSRADVLGANCGIGPQNVLEAVKKIGSIYEGELSAMPNAGLASFHQGKFYYPFNPDYFARYGEKLIKAGVKVIGGCCGTTPHHIKALKEKTEGLEPKKRKIKILLEPKGGKEKLEKEKIESELFLKVKKGEKIVSVEIDPPRDTNIEKLLKKVENFIDYVNAFNVADSPMAKARMSPIAVGKILKDRFSKEIIIHYTTRDRNILGIQSDLLGAYALGIKNVLALGGDPPSIGDYPFATGVYDLTSDGLVELLSKLNKGSDLLGNRLGKKTGFFIGAAIGLGSGREKEKLILKKKKGAHFFITQPVYEWKSKINTIRKLKETGAFLMVSIMPLVSYKSAEYFHYEVPGIEVGERILKLLKTGDKKAQEKTGIDIARETISGLADTVDGFLIIPPLMKFYLLEEILKDCKKV